VKLDGALYINDDDIGTTVHDIQQNKGMTFKTQKTVYNNSINLQQNKASFHQVFRFLQSQKSSRAFFLQTLLNDWRMLALAGNELSR